jgi:hypothetical protein
MVVFGVIGFLVLMLVFVITRNQGIQLDFKKLVHAHKVLQSQNKYSLGIVMTMSCKLQHAFQIKLTALKTGGLINQHDYDIVNFILENFQYIIVQCCQHNETVEVAVRKAIKGQEITIDDIKQFISRQSSEVRVLWCKNSIDGFVAACHNLVADKGKVQTTPESSESSSNE